MLAWILFLSLFAIGASMMIISIYKSITEPDPEDFQIQDLDIDAPYGDFLCQKEIYEN